MDTPVDVAACSDEELLDLARTGDDAAFAVVYERHLSFAMQVARCYRLHGEGEDVVSEAFTAMLQQVRTGGGPRTHVRAYLAVSLRREALRRAQHHVRVRPTDVAATFEGDALAPQDAFDLAEREAVHRAFAGLTERQREVLWSIEVLGYRPHEVAERLGISPNAVAALAYRARRALGEAYD